VVLALATFGPGPAAAQFTSQNVSLYAWVNLPTFGAGATSGSDVWGYVSPSGREYALMGVRNALGVVEVTNPASPVLVATIPHSASLWADIETYGTYAYVSNETGGGIDVINLANVDNGVVTLVTHLTAGGLSTTHTLNVDTVSGYLYLNGSNLNGGRMRAYSLADPAAPAFAGEVNDAGSVYCHDSRVITYTSGPYAGKQIAFCCNGGTGLDIYDVTNKGNMVRLSRSVYPNLAYCHQAWESGDRQYLYVNDELDGVNETVVFNISNLSPPQLVGGYNSGVAATDHNEYWKDGFVFEAEYRAGVRIFCADNPVSPIQVGWFDTYPENTNSGYNGVWSCYPFLPSGTLLAGDIDRGLFVLNPAAALGSGSLTITYPDGRPDLVAPQGGATLDVSIAGACGASVAPGTALLHYDAGQGFATAPLASIGPDLYQAVFPAAPCGTNVSYYFSGQTTGGTTFTDPPAAPATTYSALAASSLTKVLSDNFQTDQGWTTAIQGATSGQWQRGVPVNDPGWAYDPLADADGSGQCWLTQNALGNTDVDGGSVLLTSPQLDLSGGDLAIGYDYYFNADNPAATDRLQVQASGNGDAGPWIQVALHNVPGGTAWRSHTIFPADLQAAGVAPSSTTKVRFTATDGEPQSIVEAGVDAFRLDEVGCAALAGDLDGDGQVGILDFLALLAAWGPCPGACPPSCPADLNGDCEVGIVDFLTLLANWT
jgi:choice-of-anchor B domain-containing protein